MVFSSIFFLLFFLPIFLGTYYLVDKKYKNPVILLFSIFFYSWGAPKFVFILLISTYLDFYLVKWMHNHSNLLVKKWLLATSVLLNVGLLAYFKYANFFVENISILLVNMGFESILWVKVVLPIGISFYTFQTLTYSIDIYRNVHKPLDKVSEYILYIIMFPQLIAGPIVRYNQIAGQIRNRQESMEDRLVGFYRFCIGLGKKVLIANELGRYADANMMLDYSVMSSTNAWIGIIAYTFQIYFDFSGYSDMAIGIGRMIGFKFPENFDNPYCSKSITEFWRRWHITLGAWMKNYLYIPLGGSRVNSKYKLYFNLWLVFLISGLWHGASWNFIVWGAFHGLFLVLERLLLNKLFSKIPAFLSYIYTFFITVMGWVVFRIENINNVFLFYKKLFSFDFDTIRLYDMYDYFIALFFAVVFSFFILLPYGKKIQNSIFFANYSNKKLIIMFFVSIFIFVLSVAGITSSSFNPFIYFRF